MHSTEHYDGHHEDILCTDGRSHKFGIISVSEVNMQSAQWSWMRKHIERNSVHTLFLVLISLTLMVRGKCRNSPEFTLWSFTLNDIPILSGQSGIKILSEMKCFPHPPPFPYNLFCSSASPLSMLSTCLYFSQDKTTNFLMNISW